MRHNDPGSNRPLHQRPNAQGGPFDRPGRHFQSVSRRVEGDHSYEFVYVYDEDGEVVEPECFWLMTGLSDDGLRIVSRWMDYGHHKMAMGSDAVPFRLYGTKTHTLQTVRKWFRDPRCEVQEFAGIPQTLPVSR